MNKSLTEFLQNQQTLMTAGHTIEEPKKVGILDRIGKTIRGFLPSPIKTILGISRERDLYVSDRDYHMSVEYDRLKDVGLSPQEAQKALIEGVDFSFGSFGAKINTSFIPEKYREAYSQSKNEEIINMMTYSTLGTVGKAGGVKRVTGEKLVLKYGDKAAARIINKGPKFAEDALKKGGEAIVKKAGIRAPDFFGAKITPEVIKDVKKTIPVISKAVKEQGLKDLPAIQEGQKVSAFTAKLIREGKLNPDQSPTLRTLAKKYNMIDSKGKVIGEELATQLELMMTEGGKTLNIASQWGRQLHSELAKMGIKTIAPKPTFWEKIGNTQRSVINLWRASLVSQLRTGMRNLGVFGYRYTMNIMDDAMQGAYLTVTGKKPVKVAFGPAVEDILALGRVLKPKGRQVVLNALDASPALKTKAWQYTASDIATGNKVTNLLATFTRLQSYTTRTINMNAKIGAWARASGKNFYDIKPTDIPTKVLREAIDAALDMDLMKQPQGALAKQTLKLFHDVPILNAITYPFPRYMSNAIRAIYEFSPLAMTKFFSKDALTKLAAGDRASLSIMNKAMLGTMGYVAAHRVRNSKYAGEKWHELKVGDKTYDIRYWGPWISAYFFVADAIKTGGKGYGPQDWMSGMLGMNRMAGTTLFLTSQLAGHEDWQGFKKAFTEWSAEFIGGFGNPAMTVKDFFSIIDDEERQLRYTKEDPWLGPFKARVPFLSQTLPQLPTMTRSGPFTVEQFDPALKQITALPRKDKNYLETEIDRLGIQLWRLRPKTGDAWLDRMLTDGTGDFMQLINDAMEKHPNYETLEDGAREDLIRESISEAKKMAKQKFFAEYENEIVDHYLDNMRPMKKEERVEYIESLKNKGLLPVSIQKKLLEQIELFSS